MSDKARALRVETAKWGRIVNDREKPAHLVALAGRRVAELQLELEALDGTPPSITLADCEAFETSIRAANQRVLSGQVPQFSNQANFRGEYRRRERVAETELVSGPVNEALAARRTNRVSIFASPDPLPLGAGAGYSDGGRAFASETGRLTDNGPAFQRHPTNLSGRSAD